MICHQFDTRSSASIRDRLVSGFGKYPNMIRKSKDDVNDNWRSNVLCSTEKLLKTKMIRTKVIQMSRCMGQHGAHLGPVGPRWAPCWPMTLAIRDYNQIYSTENFIMIGSMLDGCNSTHTVLHTVAHQTTWLWRQVVYISIDIQTQETWQLEQTLLGVNECNEYKSVDKWICLADIHSLYGTWYLI